MLYQGVVAAFTSVLLTLGNPISRNTALTTFGLPVYLPEIHPGTLSSFPRGRMNIGVVFMSTAKVVIQTQTHRYPLRHAIHYTPKMVTD